MTTPYGARERALEQMATTKSKDPKKRGKGKGVASLRLLKGIREGWPAERLQLIGQRVFLVAFLAFLTWGSLQVQRSVRNDERYGVANWKLHFGTFPDWVTPDIRQEIESLGMQVPDNPAVDITNVGDLTVFEPGLFDHIRNSLLEHPWVRSIPSIRLQYPGLAGPDSGDVFATSGALEVDLELRRPIAIVGYGDRFYLADFEARRLGEPLEAASLEQYRLPIIVGADLFHEGEAPASGEIWKTREIHEGLAVAFELFHIDIARRYPDHFVEMISIENVGGGMQPRDPEILLNARGLPTLAWGRSPVSRGARIVATAKKLKNLERVLQNPRACSSLSLVRLNVPGRMVGVSLH